MDQDDIDDCHNAPANKGFLGESYELAEYVDPAAFRLIHGDIYIF